MDHFQVYLQQVPPAPLHLALVAAVVAVVAVALPLVGLVAAAEVL